MIVCQSIRKSYWLEDTETEILKGISLTIMQGEFVAIMGPSGSGKSTLMNMLGLLDVPTSGVFSLDGVETQSLSESDLSKLRSKRIGFVFQQFNLLARTTALENVLLPAVYTALPEPPSQRAKQLLTEVGLGQRLDHVPSRLSGGQQQRVAIARALMNDPDIILADEPTGNLDTQSQTDVMALFRTLNTAGKTIILITHEQDVAAYADRVITIKDGQVVSDTQTDRPSKPPKMVSTALAQPNAGYRFFTNLNQAKRALSANKLRTLLSMLGILIGVAALVAMLGLGKGAQADIEARLSSLGSNLLVLSPGSPRQGAVSLDAGSATRLTEADGEMIQKNVPQVKRVSATVSGRVRVKSGNRNASTQLQGVLPHYEHMRAMTPSDGHFFTNRDNRSRKRVALIGTTVAKALYGDPETGALSESPVGKPIMIDRTVFTVIGVLPEKGSTGWRDQDDIVIVPLNTAMYRLLGRNYVDSIEIEMATKESMASAEQLIDTAIRKRHRIEDDKDDAFRIRNLSQIQDAMAATSQTMSVLLAAIAIISLIVGGIGVMNIMLVSVVERTREIGLRKSLGATRQMILQQFLIESICISCLGGGLGILLGVGITAIVSQSAGWTIIHTPGAILGALGFSILTGIGFGFWPARKAAGLNPIDALRYE